MGSTAAACLPDRRAHYHDANVCRVQHVCGLELRRWFSTPDAPGSSITATHVIMEGNGCQEQYPLTNAFPAMVCYDTNSGGFGDSWSGQNTTLDSFSCNDCQDLYNTKDGFIGPHTWISTLTITNSTSIGNMGQNWKWGRRHCSQQHHLHQ